MKLYFLNSQDASTEFSKNRFIHQLQPLEINVRTHGAVPLSQNLPEMRVLAQKYWTNNLVTFTEDEIQALKWYMKMVCRMMCEKSSQLLPEKVKLIKIRAVLDWSFPYTIGNCIILPELKVREMVVAKCQRTPDLIVSGFSTLFREMVHMHQCAHFNLYQKIYHDLWGFECIHPTDIIYSDFYRKYWVTNPNTPEIKYIIPIIQPGTNGLVDWFLPLLLLNPDNPRKVMGVLIKLTQVWNAQLNRYQYYTTRDYRSLCSLKEYSNKFYGMNYQLYHPDVIMANLITDWVVTNKTYADEAFKSTKFYSILHFFNTLF